MGNLQFEGKWVLVTGASSGLGHEMAKQLAANYRANLILVARRREKLETLKAEIESKTSSEVLLIIADLSNHEEIKNVLHICLQKPGFYAAILNAGVTYFGVHTQLAWEQFEQMLKTNVVSIVQMTNRLTTYFDQPGKEGGVMIVSSMAAKWPVPYQAAYSGTKGFLYNFTLALSQELENPHYSLTVFMPGGIATEMTNTESFSSLSSYLMPVKQVAKEGLYAFKKRKLSYIPGFFNRLSGVFSPFIPSAFVLRQMKKVYKNALFKKAH
ncbi:hypothetical protein SAMN05216436_13112 [bacterium A37T11]|nr:hypothetical protein SAMN05216436_13112 [bacterium A37T11]